MQSDPFALPSEPPKPRFYFDFRIGDQVTRDDEGLVFEDLQKAELNAAITAAEIGRGHWPENNVSEVAIDILDEHRQWLARVTVSLRVERALSVL